MKPVSILLFCVLWLGGCAFLPAEDVEISVAPLVQEPPPPTAVSDLQQLLTTDIPPRDLRDLTRRYKQVDVPEQLPAPQHQTRDLHTFWYKEGATDETRQAEARLAYQDGQVQLWIDQRERIDVADLQEVAQVLTNEILPTNRDLFGTDPAGPLTVLHLSEIGGGTIGYFSAADSFPTAVNPLSNERKMAYVSLELAPLASEDYYEVLAHELQHMMQWYNDGNETTWLNEGLAELAVTLNGYGTSQHVPSALEAPDTPLTNFQYNSADYGTSYLFATYFHDRLGTDAVRQLARDPDNGLRSVENGLQASGLSLTQLFGDWVATNYLASHGRGQGVYQYDSIALNEEVATRPWPDETVTASVHQFGTDYYRLAGDAPVTLAFTGTTQTNLLDTTPYSGAHFWSTVPSDSSNMHLTRAFDLSDTAVSTVTLRFWTWYDIELGWDYAYVSVSDDGGETWTMLETIATNKANPHGNNLGAGYTGTSGSLDVPAWREQTADLSSWLGTENLLVRFEYVTDDAVQNQGFAVDDIRIEGLGFSDDVESAEEAEAWTAVGFVRHGNVLPQTWLVQEILLPHGRDGAVQVRHIPLDEYQRAAWTVPLGEEWAEAIVTVSATTPLVMYPATYQISPMRVSD